MHNFKRMTGRADRLVRLCLSRPVAVARLARPRWVDDPLPVLVPILVLVFVDAPVALLHGLVQKPLRAPCRPSLLLLLALHRLRQPHLAGGLFASRFKVQDKEKGTWHGLDARGACPGPAKRGLGCNVSAESFDSESRMYTSSRDN